jgi:hypothetical protein
VLNILERHRAHLFDRHILWLAAKLDRILHLDERLTLAPDGSTTQVALAQQSFRAEWSAARLPIA